MRKTFFTFGAIVVVAAAIAIYFVMFRFDSVLETRIERAATLAMGSHVEVHGVKTSLRDGTLTVQEVSVANPPGFENPYAARLNSLEAAVDYEHREIKRLVIDKPEFIIEEVGGETNFGQILAALEAGAGSGAPAAEGTETGTQNEEPVIVIRHFRINETRAAFQSRSLDRFTDVNVEAIEMNDLRGTPTELAQLIAREVVSELSSEAATEVIKAKASKQFDETSGAVSNTIRDLLGKDKDDASDPAADPQSDE